MNRHDRGMDYSVDLSDHVEGLRDALGAFVHHARDAGPDAAVPTAPDWDVRHLTAHLGMIHRWATAALQGRRVEPDPQEGLDVEDPLAWLHHGGLRLLEAVHHAPDDLDAPVFLRDAPPPRQFWARRQCHETTIHAVDALAAALGRMPRAEDTWISREIALDGIDELVTGFVTRSRSPLRSERPVRIVVRPHDVERSWRVTVSEEPAVTERFEHGHHHGDVLLEASSVALYLALWNRTDSVDAEGFDLWRRTARITWS